MAARHHVTANKSLMTTHSNLRTGGQILADQLQIHGVDMAFGVPGESYLGLLDALYDTPIRYVICRQEGGAAMMAEAYGKLTGRPGIAMVTRGPGATNASHGVHIARQDSTPMILLVGQVARDMARLRALLAEAQRPFMILGGGGWDAEACADIQAFAENFDLPVGVSFRRQDYFDNRHPNYAGHVGISVAPPLSDRVRDADVLILIGTRLGEASSRSYALIGIPKPTQTLVHVHAGAEELGLIYAADLPIHAGMRAFAAAARALEPVDSSAWREQTKVAHEQYLASIQPKPTPGALQLGEVMVWLRENLPEDAIVSNGAGNFCVWVNGFYQYRHFRSQLGPTSGSMGYSTPAAVAAKLVHPDRTVVCVAGDGDFLMTGQEMATAAQYELPVIWLIVNNRMYGTIRMHQERDYPTRVIGTDLKNPDFAALARAYGGFGEVVEKTSDFADAFRRAEAARTFALLELRVDPEAITPRASLREIREGARGKR